MTERIGVPFLRVKLSFEIAIATPFFFEIQVLNNSKFEYRAWIVENRDSNFFSINFR